jgi:hypothetical protein
MTFNELVFSLSLRAKARSLSSLSLPSVVIPNAVRDLVFRNFTAGPIAWISGVPLVSCGYFIFYLNVKCLAV